MIEEIEEDRFKHQPSEGLVAAPTDTAAHRSTRNSADRRIVVDLIWNSASSTPESKNKREKNGA